MVPSVAARKEDAVVAAQQCQLYAKRLSSCFKLHSKAWRRNVAKFLQKGIQLLAKGREGKTVCIRDRAGSRRSAPRGTDGGTAAQPQNRSASVNGSDQSQRG